MKNIRTIVTLAAIAVMVYFGGVDTMTEVAALESNGSVIIALFLEVGLAATLAVILILLRMPSDRNQHDREKPQKESAVKKGGKQNTRWWRH